MSRVPSKLTLFFVVGCALAFYFLPRRAESVKAFLRQREQARIESELKRLVKDRIRESVCRTTDLCAYRSLEWDEITRIDSASYTVVHTFRMNREERRYLFRASPGSIHEMHRIR